jgi:Transcription factor involved in chromatin remodeling, contains bromodomain
MVKRGRGRKRKARQDPVVDEEQNDSVAAKNNTTDSQEAKTTASLKDDSDDQKATVASCSHNAHLEAKPVEGLNIDAASGDKHEKVSNGDGSMKDDSNEYSMIRKCIVENDGKEENLVRLIGLKNLFSKQLPKMPRDYIVRLVFDRRHKSLAILSDDPNVQGTDDEIIGGICYRAYPEMKFAEIAFCAVSQTQQVKVSE